MLTLVNQAVKFMRARHPKGEIYYRILFRCYFSPVPETQQSIMATLENEGYIFSERPCGNTEMML